MIDNRYSWWIVKSMIIHYLLILIVQSENHLQAGSLASKCSVDDFTPDRWLTIRWSGNSKQCFGSPLNRNIWIPLSPQIPPKHQIVEEAACIITRLNQTILEPQDIETSSSLLPLQAPKGFVPRDGVFFEHIENTLRN